MILLFGDRFLFLFKVASILKRLKLALRQLLPNCGSAWTHPAPHGLASGPSHELSHVEPVFMSCSTSVSNGNWNAIPKQYITLLNLHRIHSCCQSNPKTCQQEKNIHQIQWQWLTKQRNTNLPHWFFSPFLYKKDRDLIYSSMSRKLS